MKNYCPPKTIISIEDVKFSYPGRKWESHFSQLFIRAGELLIITGPNGSGKSTLLKIMAKMIEPLQGKVMLNHKPLSSYSRLEFAKIVGYLPQKTDVPPGISSEEVVLMGRYAHRRHSWFCTSEDLSVARKCMAQTGTTVFKDIKFSNLSGGEQQSVLLASALAQQPQVLLLDEPGQGLDIHRKINFFHSIKQLVKKGIGVVAISHDLNMATVFADKSALLSQGKIISVGEVKQVFSKKNMESVYGKVFCYAEHPELDLPILLPSFQTNNINYNC